MDPHLNLFYSYNRDNLLIENNLTRAWVVTLRLLSGKTRHRMLYTLLDGQAARHLPDRRLGDINFEAVDFFLQGNVAMSRTKRCNPHYLIVIASKKHAVDSEEAGPRREVAETLYHSIPDAFLIDPADNGYCFLIECKIRDNPVNDEQVKSHARDWFDVTNPADLKQIVLPLTWLEVAEGLLAAQAHAEPYEINLLNQLIEYLSFNDYQLFRGFKVAELKPPPQLALKSLPPSHFLRLRQLATPPQFRIGPV